MGSALFVACTNVGQAMIETICESETIRTKIVGIVNLNVKRSLSKANYRTYLDVAEKYGIPLHFCDNVNDPETLAWIADKNPDLIVQTGWSQKFRDELLNLPRFGCVGEHPAPLPKGRGAACVNWAILTGEKEWGDSFFRMVEEYDRGEPYAQEKFEIAPYDDVKTVYDKVALASRKIIAEHIDDWTEGRFAPLPLDESQATYYPRRRPSDGLFTFDKPATELYDFIRAQTDPYPGAFFTVGDAKIVVLSARLSERTVDAPPGTTFGATENGGVLVACGDGRLLELLRYRREDGAVLWFAEASPFSDASNAEK